MEQPNSARDTVKAIFEQCFETDYMQPTLVHFLVEEAMSRQSNPAERNRLRIVYAGNRTIIGDITLGPGDVLPVPEAEVERTREMVGQMSSEELEASWRKQIKLQ